MSIRKGIGNLILRVIAVSIYPGAIIETVRGVFTARSARNDSMYECNAALLEQ